MHLSPTKAYCAPSVTGRKCTPQKGQQNLARDRPGIPKIVASIYETRRIHLCIACVTQVYTLLVEDVNGTR